MTRCIQLIRMRKPAPLISPQRLHLRHLNLPRRWALLPRLPNRHHRLFPRGSPEPHVSPQPRARRDPLSWRAAAPRAGRIPTRGAIRRGDVADPFAPAELEHVGEALPTDLPTVLGRTPKTYLCVSRIGSALQIT